MRPMLMPAGAFLAAVGVRAAGGSSGWLVAGGALAAGCAMLVGRPHRLRAALFALLAWSAGIHGMRVAESRANERVTSWTAERGTAIALSITGTVRSLAERDARGGWSIRLAARKDGDPRSAVLRMRLYVGGGGEPAASAIESLLPGDEIRAWCRVRRPAPEVDPTRGDREAQLRSRGLELEGTVKSPRLIERTRAGAPSFLRAIAISKAFARRRLDHALGADPLARALVGAMLLGDRALVDADVERGLRDAGLVHLLSVSGLHVALVLLALWTIVARVRLARSVRLLLMLAGIVSLVAFVGTDAPVLRSAGCAALLLVGHALGRDGDPLNTLAGIAALLVAIDPYALANLGFQLSFAATAGILCLARPTAAALPLPKAISIGTGVSMSAYLASTPLAILHFGRAAPVSLLSNLAAAAVCAATMAAGASVIALGSVPGVGAACTWGARASAHALIGITELAARVPAGSFRVAAPAPWVLAAYYVLLATVARSRWRRLAFALLLLALHLGPPPQRPVHDVEMSVVDVGQGQAVVLRGPSGGFVLIDAGGTGGGRFDAGDRLVAPFLAAHGCRRIDALIVTHAHDDHAGGVPALLRDFEVGELWLSAGFHRDPVLARLAAQARERGTALVLAERGTELARAGLELHVLHPNRIDATAPQNERSIVTLARLGDRRLLVPGDLEAKGERSILDSSEDLHADVLVLGHHGSSTSSTAAFLDAVGPSVAIVSCGAGNRFGHPAPEVLERLSRRGVHIRRTDLEGSIRIALSTP